MAKNQTKATEPETTAAPYVTKYTIEELAEASTAFATDKLIVLAALKSAGKDSYSMDEATKIVKAFKSKEVKN